MPFGSKNGRVSDPGDFIDSTLQGEGDWYRAEEARARLGSGLRYYGSSVGAVRGTIRDVGRRHPGMTHDEVTALSSELWAVPVFERRLAAIVLLQSNARLLGNSDLTRIEGFVREARLRALVDPLAMDVIGPLVSGLDGQGRARAEGVLDRWMREPEVWLRRAALLSPLRELRAGAGDWDGFVRRANSALAERSESGQEGQVVREAVSFVLSDMGRHRPELAFSPRRP
ncbi:MAG: alkylation repair protein [Arthrobacter sp.]|nr:alkylation repair protein [Arthrobacter sp.]